TPFGSEAKVGVSRVTRTLSTRRLVRGAFRGQQMGAEQVCEREIIPGLSACIEAAALSCCEQPSTSRDKTPDRGHLGIRHGPKIRENQKGEPAGLSVDVIGMHRQV